MGWQMIPQTQRRRHRQRGGNRPHEATETPRQPKRKSESGSRNQRRTNRRVQPAERGLSPAQRDLHLVQRNGRPCVGAITRANKQMAPSPVEDNQDAAAAWKEGTMRRTQWKMPRMPPHRKPHCGGDLAIIITRSSI